MAFWGRKRSCSCCVVPDASILTPRKTPPAQHIATDPHQHPQSTIITWAISTYASHHPVKGEAPRGTLRPYLTTLWGYSPQEPPRPPSHFWQATDADHMLSPPTPKPGATRWEGNDEDDDNTVSNRAELEKEKRKWRAGERTWCILRIQRS
jgi:hypothetical protein